MKRIRGLIVGIVFFLMVFSVFAEEVSYDHSKAIRFLENRITSSSDIPELGFGILAFEEWGVDNDNYVDLLKSRLDEDENCFPSEDCNVKDTAIALFVLDTLGDLDTLGEDVKDYVEWVDSQRGVFSENNPGNWNLQIITSGEGECEVYENEEKKAVVLVDGNNQIKIGNSLMDWVSLRDIGIFFDEPIEEVGVECDVDSSVIVSLVRIEGNSFYIEEQESGKDVEFEINNACYLMKEGDSVCSKQATYYGAWVLKEAGYSNVVESYMDSVKESEWDYAILNLIDSKQEYEDELIDNIDEDTNAWESLYVSSFVIYSLRGRGYDEEISLAADWIKSNQNDDGSFGSGNLVLDTAVSLYFGLGDRDSPSDDGDDRGDDTGDGEGDDDVAFCGNNILEIGEECDTSIDTIEEGALRDCEGLCDAFDCSCRIFPVFCESDADCGEGEKCDVITEECSVVTDCVVDEECRAGEECDYFTGRCSAPGDDDSGDEGAECTKENEILVCNAGEVCNEFLGKCVSSDGDETPNFEVDCGDGIDDDEDGDVDCEDSDCEGDSDCEKGRSYWWIWLIVILVVGVAIFFFYSKFAGQKKPSTKPGYFDFGEKKDGGKKGGGKKSAPAFRRPMMRSTGSPKDFGMESKLDKSIREAEKLLKGEGK